MTSVLDVRLLCTNLLFIVLLQEKNVCLVGYFNIICFLSLISLLQFCGLFKGKYWTKLYQTQQQKISMEVNLFMYIPIISSFWVN